MDLQPKNFIKQLSFNTFIPYFYPFMMFPLKFWRRKAIGMMDFKKGDHVLIPGAGGGHDFAMLPDYVTVTGVDISDIMLGIARAKAEFMGLSKRVKLVHMDGENLRFADNSFDKAILGLFLTCVYDPKKAFAEVVRVVKPGGEILIYDHLVGRKKWATKLLSSMDTILKYNFCSFIREIDIIIEEQPVSIIKNIHGDPFGFVKGFLLCKDREYKEEVKPKGLFAKLYKHLLNII
ncbi:MAG: methyltransferase domain-containing protein [Nitrospirae bacterium]|nr:methyltransferase domain-containing protein [Nitrospirota bacterium]